MSMSKTCLCLLCCTLLVHLFCWVPQLRSSLQFWEECCALKLPGFHHHPGFCRVVVSPAFSWSYNYAKAVSLQWVEQVSSSCFLEGQWEADQVEAGTEKCLLTLALNVFYCKEAKESISILIATEKGRVAHWQNSSICVEWSFGGLCLLMLISYKLPVLIKQSDASQKFCFFHAKEGKSCKTVSPIQVRM